MNEQLAKNMTVFKSLIERKNELENSLKDSYAELNTLKSEKVNKPTQEELVNKYYNAHKKPIENQINARFKIEWKEIGGALIGIIVALVLALFGLLCTPKHHYFWATLFFLLALLSFGAACKSIYDGCIWHLLNYFKSTKKNEIIKENNNKAEQENKKLYQALKNNPELFVGERLKELEQDYELLMEDRVKQFNELNRLIARCNEELISIKAKIEKCCSYFGIPLSGTNKVPRLLEIIKDGRADTVKEALNLLEEDAFRERQASAIDTRNNMLWRQYQDQLRFQEEQHRFQEQTLEEQRRFQEQSLEEQRRFQEQESQVELQKRKEAGSRQCIACKYRMSCRNRYNNMGTCGGFVPD